MRRSLDLPAGALHDRLIHHARIFELRRQLPTHRQPEATRRQASRCRGQAPQSHIPAPLGHVLALEFMTTGDVRRRPAVRPDIDRFSAARRVRVVETADMPLAQAQRLRRRRPTETAPPNPPERVDETRHPYLRVTPIPPVQPDKRVLRKPDITNVTQRVRLDAC
jgi:hypothetical protein